MGNKSVIISNKTCVIIIVFVMVFGGFTYLEISTTWTLVIGFSIIINCLLFGIAKIIMLLQRKNKFKN